MAAEVPKPNDIQKSIEFTKVALTVFMPGCHWTRTSVACRIGFAMSVTRIAEKEPIMAQKGRTMPVMMMPGSMMTPVGVAGRIVSVIVVVSR